MESRTESIRMTSRGTDGNLIQKTHSSYLNQESNQKPQEWPLVKLISTPQSLEPKDLRGLYSHIRDSSMRHRYKRDPMGYLTGQVRCRKETYRTRVPLVALVSGSLTLLGPNSI